MQLNRRLYDIMAPSAQQAKIDQICLGLGYTSVALSNGDIGIAYTYFDQKTGCTLVHDYCDYEGRPATDLLELIKSPEPLKRSMALALINALCQPRLSRLKPDEENQTLFGALNIGPATRLAMVGLFKPLVKLLEADGVRVKVIDEFRGIGNKEQFQQKLSQWADAVLITSTTILNNSFEEVMSHVGRRAKVALLGPSTPMVAEAFAPIGVKALAGIVVRETASILKAVRHGLGTPYLHRHSDKITLTL